MNYGIYNSAAGALVQNARVEVTSNNMANAKTPGFKKNIMSFMDRRPETMESGHYEARNEILDRMHGGVFIKGTPWDPQSGQIKQTGRSLDAAIDGDGFFRVTNGKKNYLTRAGNFRFNSNNELVTMNGDFQVLNSDGEPITVDQTDEIKFGKDGTIYSNNESIDQLGLVDVKSTDKLAKKGKVRFLNKGGSENLKPFNANVVGGALEQSNVQSVKELSNMIRAQRSYGSNLKAMQIQDSTIDTAVSQVGRPSG